MKMRVTGILEKKRYTKDSLAKIHELEIAEKLNQSVNLYETPRELPKEIIHMAIITELPRNSIDNPVECFPQLEFHLIIGEDLPADIKLGDELLLNFVLQR